MISSVMPNDSKMASCYFFLPPINNQHMSGMSDLLAEGLTDCRQIRNFNFSLILSSNCAILTK